MAVIKLPVFLRYRFVRLAQLRYLPVLSQWDWVWCWDKLWCDKLSAVLLLKFGYIMFVVEKVAVYIAWHEGDDIHFPQCATMKFNIVRVVQR